MTDQEAIAQAKAIASAFVPKHRDVVEDRISEAERLAKIREWERALAQARYLFEKDIAKRFNARTGVQVVDGVTCIQCSIELFEAVSAAKAELRFLEAS
jgi:hypothetical protein